MASMAKPLKGILKNTPAAAENKPATHSRRQRTEEENAEIARKHAAILQQRKELETSIFLAIEKLTEFPLNKGPSFDAAHPAPSDVAAFTQLVRIFQPGDYDDLIEERNTCGLCGYALCAKPRQQFVGKGTWKLVNAGRKDFGIASKRELEKWCSQACARRALYIKVQLNETAAWERVGIPDLAVELLQEEDKKKKPKEPTSAEAQLAQDLARLKLNEERKLGKDAMALALERGDVKSTGIEEEDSNGKTKEARIEPTVPLVDINIYEKNITTAPTEPTLKGDADAHLRTEGHKTKFTGA